MSNNNSTTIKLVRFIGQLLPDEYKVYEAIILLSENKCCIYENQQEIVDSYAVKLAQYGTMTPKMLETARNIVKMHGKQLFTLMTGTPLIAQSNSNDNDDGGTMHAPVGGGSTTSDENEQNDDDLPPF